MNVYQQKMIADAKAKAEIEDYDPEAIKEKRLARIKELKRNPGDDNYATISASLHDAAFQGRPDAVKYFIRAMHVPVDDYDTKGYCAIHYSAQNGYIDVTEYLLDVGCEVDVASTSGCTALMMAAKKNQPDMLDFLYDAGSDLVAQDNSGQTAAHYAAQEDNEQCIITLHELGLVRQEYELKLAEEPELDEGDLLPDIPLTTELKEDGSVVPAAQEDEKEPVPLFRALQTVETVSKNGGTPLHIAAVFDSRRTIKVLLDLEVDVNVRDNMMETPMHKAARRNYILAYNMLQEAGGRDCLLNLMGESPADVLVDR